MACVSEARGRQCAVSVSVVDVCCHGGQRATASVGPFVDALGSVVPEHKCLCEVRVCVSALSPVFRFPVLGTCQ